MRSAIFAVALVLFASSARADKREEARAHFEKGSSAYALGRYGEAADEYEKAFDLRADPALLFNAAQAHRLAGNKPRALLLYQNYLRVYGASVTNREDVQRYIAALKRAIDSEASPTTTAPSPSPTPSAMPVAREPDPVPVVAPTRDANPGRTKLFVGVGVAAGGVVLAGLGGLMLALAHGAANEINHPAPGYVFNPGTEAAAKTDQTVGIVLFAAGGVALVTGAVLAVLGGRERAASRVAVAPWGGPSSGGALVRVSF